MSIRRSSVLFIAHAEVLTTQHCYMVSAEDESLLGSGLATVSVLSDLKGC